MAALKYTGVNLSGLEFGSGIGTVNTTYVMPGQNNYSYWAQNVDSNIIRLPFTWERLQPQLGGQLDQNYLSYLQDSASYAKANGMTLILDMHNYARYNGNVVTSSQLTDVWTKLGQVFKGDTSVWFDLMNEPHDISATQWANISQQTVNSMRASGIDNKILLEGTSWSGAHSWINSGNAAAYSNFKDPANNYAYDVHQYLDSDSSGTSTTAVPGSGSTRLVAVTEWAEATGQKLFLGEAGLANNAGSEAETKAMINYMQSHSNAWLGFTLWGAGPWWPQDYTFNINPNGLGTGNVTNDPSIQNLMSYLQSGGGTVDNLPPVAQPDTFTGTKDIAIAGNVLANNGHGADSDPNAGTTLSVVPTTLTTAHGHVSLTADGKFTYTPTSGYTGADSFKYTLLDGQGGQAEGTVSITLNPSTTPSSYTKNGTAGGDKLEADQKIGTTLNGLGGADYLIGHDGNDTLNGGDGNDKMFAYWGNDTLAGGKGSDALSGGPGTDKFVFKAADLGTGVDTISDFSVAQGDKIDIVDVLQGHYDPSKNALADFVRITTSGSNSVLSVDPSGHAGASGWTQVATITGATGLTDKQLILPQSSTPTETGLIVNGTNGDDKLEANPKIGTTLNGLGGADYLIGHDGNDTLNGGDGNDKMFAYWGNDTLTGGKGSDTLSGGIGTDRYVFKAADLGTGVDTVSDFSVAQGDKIDIVDVLQGHYDPVNKALTDFVRISTSGSNSVLSVDLSGHAGASGWTPVATIAGTGLTDEQLLVTSGNLIVS